MKKFIALLLAALLCLSMLSACSTKAETAADEPAKTDASAAEETKTEETAEETKTEETASDDKVKCFLVSPLIGCSAWGNCQKGFEEAAAAEGWDYTYLGPVTTANTTEMVELCETALSNGADIIIGNWNDQEAFNDVVDRALEKGVTLVGINYSLPGRCEVYTGIDPVELGNIQAETLVQNMPEDEPINVVYMQPKLSSQSHNINYQSFCDKLAELRPDAVVVSQEESTSDTQVVYEKFSALLLAHPEINAFVADCSMAAVGAATLVEERGLQDSMYVQGIDGGAEILTYVLSGAADCTIIQDWLSVGRTAVSLAKTLYEGGTVEGFSGCGAYALYADGVQAYADQEGIPLD